MQKIKEDCSQFGEKLRVLNILNKHGNARYAYSI